MPSVYCKLDGQSDQCGGNMFTVQTQNEDFEFTERYSHTASLHSTFKHFSTGNE
jgi:hypothetical protein